MYIANMFPFVALASVFLSEQERIRRQGEKEEENRRKAKELAERTAEKL